MTYHIKREEDLIDELIASMRTHKLRYGHFTPPAWYSGSSTENLQEICFQLFDNLETICPDNEKEWLLERVEKITDRDVDLRTKITDVISTIYPIYSKHNRFEPSSFKKWEMRQLLKIRKYLP